MEKYLLKWKKDLSDGTGTSEEASHSADSEGAWQKEEKLSIPLPDQSQSKNIRRCADSTTGEYLFSKPKIYSNIIKIMY